MNDFVREFFEDQPELLRRYERNEARYKFKVSDKPLDGYRYLGRLVASMKNYEV